MDIVLAAFRYGKAAEAGGALDLAIQHYTKALDILYSIGHHNDPVFWSNILFSRASVYLQCQQEKFTVNDIRRALSDCPQQLPCLEEAELWFMHGKNTHSSLAVWCFSAALHFAGGKNTCSFQGDIHAHRAFAYNDIGAHSECDQDIDECRRLSDSVAWQTGHELKRQGMDMVSRGTYKEAVQLLQLAEKFLRPPYRHNQSLKQQWYECWKVLIPAAWSAKMYWKAVEAAKKCRQIQPINTARNEATIWKERGNEMFNCQNYDWAIECYNLSMQYAPHDDRELLGIIHSNRSNAYLKKKQFKRAKDDAQKCLQYRPNWSKSFHRLGSALIELKEYDCALDVLKRGLEVTQTDNDKYEIFSKIILLAYNMEDVRTKISFKLPQDCMSKYLKECVAKHYWKSLEVFLLGGGGEQSYAKGKGGLATGNCDLKEISLCDVIKSIPRSSQYYELIIALIEHGASVNGLNEKEIPLSLAVNRDDYELAVVLLRENADPAGLIRSKAGKQDDTPVHTAFRIGLSSGHWQIFRHLMDNVPSSSSASTSSPEILDKKGNSLYHLITSADKMSRHTVAEGIKLLKEYNIDPTTRNNDGKTPLRMIRQTNDPRYAMMEEIVKSFTPAVSKKKRKRKKPSKNNQKIPITTPSKCKKDEIAVQADEPVEGNIPAPVHSTTEIDLLRERISMAIESLSYETKVEKERKESASSKVKGFDESKQHIASNGNETSRELRVSAAMNTQNEEVGNKVPIPAPNLKGNPLPDGNIATDNNEDVNDDDTCDATFGKLTWEVECTQDAWKKLKDKKLPRDKKKKIVNIIRKLADGDMRGDRAKRLTGIAKESKILLFEAKIDKSARILWERAIAFSPRCSETTLPDRENEERRRIYTDVIRIWDIVLDHDTVPRKIKKIVHSYDRGTSCFLKKNLRGIQADSSSLPSSSDQTSIPNIYVPRDDPKKPTAEAVTTDDKPCSSNESSKLFFPPGSPEETEYHILKFYEFSNAMVNALLDDQNKTHFDFPFRVSELEHSVINLIPKPMTSILLLGRSGTGKTTCCLYRLWNNYQTYWQCNTLAEPNIPNVAQFKPLETEDNTDEENEEGENATGRSENQDGASLQQAARKDQVCSSSMCRVEGECERRSSMEEPITDVAMENDADGVPGGQIGEDEDTQAAVEARKFEHLHQAFITKNAVLCKEVQKNFLELCRASFSTRNDVDHKESSSVYKFVQLEEQAWPLFICSRDWLLMLDASLPGKPFFQWNENGELLRTAKGWGEEDSNLHEIPVDYSEDEDEDVDEVEGNHTAAAAGEDVDHQRDQGDFDPRREITYQVFKNEIWRKMTKRKKVDYHPSLVWTEIRSFIEGSVEALHSENGYITLEEYQTIGKKRAPNFTADRETIYELFLAYRRIKNTKGMFDEADVVNSIYHRLEHNIPAWSIHEIYVDETQDFTQAELSVIIRSCRNPNRLFFTGDTAQSIMRGIAFRFSDLKSLFFYMKESVKAVGQQNQVVVPDRVYQLTHNYRSHAGILSLASCVTDLLSCFFPESFDQIARDQGLFEGPKPVLLDSCSFSDLAVILRGHKRKTSPIEFGAHQVILVASDEVRDSLPEELSQALVMTIYEAKGLEFDDVLIYNFFKDSQARKEWRVVGSYKEKQDEEVNASGIAECPIDMECKARPLEFNPDLHKILISEFKYLYTAITRARVNVWFFDEDEEARGPMFEYFQKRGVVDVKQAKRTEDGASSLEGMFAQESKKEDWKAQGLFFYAKGLWKVASKCFRMAKEEMWVKKCCAHEQAAKAAGLTSEPRKLRMEFAKAAELFLQCDMKDEAGKCLYNAQERILQAKLYEKSGEFLKAAKIFHKEKKFSDGARNFESARDFERAVDCWLKHNRYNKALELVSRYHDLIQHGQESSIFKPPRFDQRDESICYQAARFYLNRGELHLMTDALERLPEVEDRITFLQKNGCFDQAAELLLKEGKPEEAARLMRSKGRFLDAARFSDDNKFAADCYLLAARSTIVSEKNVVFNEETKELVDGQLHRATELYARCNNVNGQAEAKFARGKFYENAENLEEAGKLYYKIFNYAAVAECFLLFMNSEKDPRKSRPIAISTLNGLLRLILALHKENQDSSERTAISMCYVYFGLVDTDDAQTKKVPHMEMVRFADLQEKPTQDDVIPTKEAEKIIEKHLCQMAANLMKQLWKKHEQINVSCAPCPRFFSGAACDVETCNDGNHDVLNRNHFADRFHALLFLVCLEERIARFLKEMKRESAKVKNQLRRMLFVVPEFTACCWLYELLFPRDGDIVSSYFLSEGDVSKLRKLVSGRIIEYAKTSMWYGSREEERWSSSDLFIEVSNLMHIAGAPDAELYNMLAVEERKFEKNERNLAIPPGMFRDRRIPGRFSIFSRALERSRSRLNLKSDVCGSAHTAIKEFLFSPAKRKGLPYPSIANAVMLLERHLTTCLMLYAGLMVNDPACILCLPESYLSMINFWDYVDRLQANRTTNTLYNAIQFDPRFSQGPEGFRRLDDDIQELTWSMVKLTFGEIVLEYNISDTMCDSSVNCVEVERVLVLVLTMLCNCGRGIPQECEQLIREHLFTLQIRQDLPQKLTKCIEDVRKAKGMQDVVRSFIQLLSHKPRQERLFDVRWDLIKAKDSRRNCQIEAYPERFYHEIDVNALSKRNNRKQHEEQTAAAEDDDVNDAQMLNEDEALRQSLESNKITEEKAHSVIVRAFRRWKSEKDAKAKHEEEVKKDAVKSHFQSFKLDKSGCTICGRVQFVDPASNLSDNTSLDPNEEATSTWQPRILQRNTFETHCSRRSPHWKKERSFAKFKAFYKERILPTIEKANQLTDEMRKLRNETEAACSLDLDRLEVVLSGLNSRIKKVEDERSWDSVHLIDQAAKEVRTATQQYIKNRKDGARAQDSGDEDIVADDCIDDSTVGHLKDVNSIRARKKRSAQRPKRR